MLGWKRAPSCFCCNMDIAGSATAIGATSVFRSFPFFYLFGLAPLAVITAKAAHQGLLQGRKGRTWGLRRMGGGSGSSVRRCYKQHIIDWGLDVNACFVCFKIPPLYLELKGSGKARGVLAGSRASHNVVYPLRRERERGKMVRVKITNARSASCRACCARGDRGS